MSIASSARRRLAVAVAGVALVYVGLLLHPQPLFAYQLAHAGIVVHATRPIPREMERTLERARARLERSPLYDPAFVPDVFICEPRWLFALFVRSNYRVAGVADVFIGRHVFLRESDMEHDRLIAPSGKPVAADRPLSYFVAHEIMHLVHGRRLGRVAYARLPQWVDDGDADFVARDIDLADTLGRMQRGERELDPVRSGLYLRYDLMVAYVLQKRGMPVDALLASPPARDLVERELLGLRSW